MVTGGTNSGNGVITISYTIDATLTAGLASGSAYPIGTTENTLSFIDGGGNTVSCNFNVMIEDNEDPVLMVPADIAQDTDAGVCGAVVNYTITTSDNCDFAPETVAGFSLLGTFNEKTYFLSDVAMGPGAIYSDAATNGYELVSITSAAENAFVRLEANAAGATGDLTIGFNDLDVEGTFVWQNGDPVTYTNWNSGEPNNQGDEDYVTMQPSGRWADFPNIGGNRYIIQFDGSLEQTAGLASGEVFPVGTTTNTYVLTDAFGNSVTESFDVVVTDNENPDAQCVADFTVQLDANGQATITAADIDNGSTDACGIASTSVDVTDFDCSNVGANVVTLTVTDNNGNTSTCTTTVTVEDTTGVVVVSGPVDIFTGTGPNDDACSTVVNYDPVTIDSFVLDNNCGDSTTFAVSQTGGLGSGSVFPVGTTTETYTIVDNNGNETEYSFEITISDTTNPVIDCPEDIIVSEDENDLYVILDYTTGASDNCSTGDDLTITQTPVAGTSVGVGVTTVTVEATDLVGNTTTCSFDITVDSTLGIDEDESTLGDIEIYPNPTSNTINVEIGSQGVEKIVLFDIKGRKLKEFEIANSGQFTTQIDLGDFAEGVYLLQFIKNKEQVTKRIIKRN
ncbi:HYR domain-containing protein [Dokdonia sinensis]|uniref:HYR domain-containing protein n=1 Tax=Dokdonia sinensis TaxID=2479847 RepID=A0A3M0GAJ5_9FLAO|nr:HYR domain-containing protein [Dokdonia sinensis]